jgi:hypothetical protein
MQLLFLKYPNKIGLDKLNKYAEILEENMYSSFSDKLSTLEYEKAF